MHSTLKSMIGDEWEGEVHQRFKGAVIKSDTGWTASLKVVTADGTYTRKLEVNTCEAATQVVALLIVLALDPVLIMESENPVLKSSLAAIDEASRSKKTADDDESFPPPAEAPPEPELVPTSPSSIPEEAPQNTPGPGSLFFAGTSFVADVGTMSPFGPGLSLDGAFSFGLFHTVLSVRYLPPRDIDVPGSDTGIYRPQLIGGALGAGARFVLKRFHVAPLLGIEVDGIFAESRRIEQPARGHVWLASAWVGASLAWVFSERVGIGVQPALHVLFNRPRFDIEDIGLVYRPKRVAGVFRLGFFVVF